MRLKNKSTLKITAVINTRSLVTLVKILIYGELNKYELHSLQYFFKEIDENDYNDDLEVFCLLSSVKIIIDAKLNDIDDRVTIMAMINTTLLDDITSETINNLMEPLLSNSYVIRNTEKETLLKRIKTYSQYSIILKKEPEFIEDLATIKIGNAADLLKVIKRFQLNIAEMHNTLYKIENAGEIGDEDMVDTSDPSFTEVYLKKAFDTSKEATHVLKTGNTHLNEAISHLGGLEMGRFYIFYGPQNSHKSNLLMHIEKWIRQNNSHSFIDEFRATGKQPTILFISLENTWIENVERMHSISGGDGFETVDTYEKVKKQWQRNNADSIISTCMIYGKANKWTIDDTKRVMEKLESENKKVIAVIVDYMKMMQDVNPNTDIRMRINNIAVDLKGLSIVGSKPIVITVHHTDTSAMNAIREAKHRGAVDLAKTINSPVFIGESKNLDQIPDTSFFIFPEQSKFNNKWYLGFARGRTRGKRTDDKYDFVAIPLKDRFKLVDNIDGNECEETVFSLAETCGDAVPDFEDMMKRRQTLREEESKLNEQPSIL